MSVSSVNQMEVAVIKWWTVPLEVFATAIPKQDIMVWTCMTVGVIRILEGYRGKKTTSFFPTCVHQSWSDFSAEPGSIPWKSAFMMEFMVQVGGRDTGSASFSSCPLFQTLSSSTDFTAVFYEVEGREKEVNIHLL